jgi:outer membrane biogenesis lipoprotein LolB
MEGLPVKHALTILAAVLLSACGETGTGTPPKPLWNSQLDQLDKAKQVDTMVQQQADDQRRQLELQTQ